MVPLAMEILAKRFVEVHVHEVYQGRYSIELVDMEPETTPIFIARVE